MSSIRDFVPLTKLGQGTFSTVYKVRRLSDQKIYALKKVRLTNLTQKQKENALNQIRILASFDCDHIVAYKQAFFDDKLNVLCIVMEFADGGDLHKLIGQKKKDFATISQKTIWKVAADILSALDHLHSKGILHRDLKSANIFIHGDQYKLGDLNVSKVNGGQLAFTQTGTPYYASPEVWRDQPYDNKSDIWSFGCILYELACLKPPFEGRDMDDLFHNVQRNIYPAIPKQYSDQLGALIEQCLQKNPKNRPNASVLLQHTLIVQFRNRKNAPVDQAKPQKQLLRTIKLPTDLRQLKMNLPGSKYQPKNINQMNTDQQYQKYAYLQNYISDRPIPSSSYQNKSAVLPQRNPIFAANYQPNIRNIKNNLVNHSQIYLSPKIGKNNYENYSISRTPYQLGMKKVDISQPVSRSEKKVSINGLQDYTDRRYKATQQKRYYQRRPNSHKKLPNFQIFQKYRQQELIKKPITMPRTQKRVVSSHGRQQNYHPFIYQIPNPLFIGEQKRENKNHEQFKKLLVKKSRVFSSNNQNFGNLPLSNGNI